MIIRLFNTDEFKESQNIQISDEAVKFFESKFKAEYSNQALVGNSKIYQTLNQMNYFQRDQIRSLRDQFNELARARPRRVTMRPDQSTLEVPEFVNKNDFKKLLAQIMTESKGFPQNADFEQIYESFDIDQKGSVDFE